MIGFALALQIIAVTGVTQGVDTSTYQTPAVRALVVEASRMNHRVPPTLGRYRAKLESEISIGSQNGAGAEMAVTLEQFASALTWDRRGEFEQHVVGYRQQAMGLQFATLGFIRNSWAVPSLYGNRLALLFGTDSTRRRPGSGSMDRRTMFAVHPLSDDREKFYRYAGGDTIQELKVGDRTIRIVRLEVAPRGVLPARSVVFSGEVDLDVDRKHIVRMRGAFAVAGDEPQSPLGSILKATRLEGIAYVELVNSEVNQEFWLPSYQRFEAQATAPLIGEAKAVFRIVSRFSDYDIETPEQAKLLASDTLRSANHALTQATADSLGAYDKWREEIGTATSTTHADDFRDVSPAKRRGDGPPATEIQTERLTDIVRYNRIEGLYTGLGLTYHGNSLLPGFEYHLLGGYAWAEQKVRARMSFEQKSGPWRYALRMGSVLDNTNDFRNPFDSSGTIGAFFGVDRYDYVSRGFALASVQRDFFGGDGRLRVESGFMRDEATVNHVQWSPLRGKRFLDNRAIQPGSYARTQLVYQWHPNTTAEFMGTGWGAQLRYLRGDGEVKFQRLELRVNERVNHGRWSFAGRFDAGTMLGSDFPPQYLFEVGNESGLTGYEYKQFVGTEAALLRGIALYRLGVFEQPIRVTQRFWLPGLAPALSFGVQSVWTSIPGGNTSSVGLNALTTPPPYSCPEPGFVGSTGWPCTSDYTSTADRVRTSISAGLRFFGGAVGINIGRPIDHQAPWKFNLVFGQAF